MLFVSQQFLELFLPAAIVAFYVLYFVRPLLGIAALLSASVIFCASNGIWQSAVLICSVLFNFAAGAALTSIPGHRNMSRKMLLAGSIAVNLLALGFFKYTKFIISNLNLGFALQVPDPQIPLPIGVSFYTFTQIAFLADVYAGRGPTRATLFNYALFVTWFPHVVAGPIIHWREMMPQFEKLGQPSGAVLRSPIHRENICRAMSLFGIGIAKKIFIADQLAPFVAKGYDAAGTLGFLDAWLLSLSYSFQLYFDFSGYSDMAIAMSLFFGVMLPYNFNSPYRATSIQDFWHRWHMTLSRWLKDYLFIPIGGSRGSLPVTLRNLFVTFLVGGIWHGAAWTFALWGMLHGLACCAHRLWIKTGIRMPAIVAVAITFLFVNATWVFFRAPDLGTALYVLTAMAAPNGRGGVLPGFLWGILAFVGILIWAAPASQRLALQTRAGAHPFAALLAGAAVLIAFVAQNASAPSPFLYFNF